MTKHPHNLLNFIVKSQPEGSNRSKRVQIVPGFKSFQKVRVQIITTIEPPLLRIVLEEQWLSWGVTVVRVL